MSIVQACSRRSLGAGTLQRGSSPRFQVEALLGSGGVARVHRAWDTWANRRVALKVPGCEVERRASVEREARLLARLNHPNVLRSFGLVCHREVTCLALQYCSGGSLAQWFRSAVPSTPVLIRIIADTCSALEHVHQQGLLHLDVKPHNLLLGADARVCLGDFGSAVDRRVNPGGRPVDESAVVTPYYMAPEQWAMAPVGERTDLWALGVILHEGYFGVSPVPLGLGMPQELAARVQAFQHDGASKDFAALLGKLLAPDPAARFQSAGELRQALLACRALLVQEASALGRPPRAVAAISCPVNGSEPRTERAELTGVSSRAPVEPESAYGVVA